MTPTELENKWYLDILIDRWIFRIKRSDSAWGNRLHTLPPIKYSKGQNRYYFEEIHPKTQGSKKNDTRIVFHFISKEEAEYCRKAVAKGIDFVYNESTDTYKP